MMAFRHVASQRQVQGAAAAALLAFLLVVASSARAIGVAAPPTPLPDASAPAATLQSAARTPSELIDEAVAASPFTPSRVPAAGAGPNEQPIAATDEPIVLVGTVVAGDGDSFVLVAAGNTPAKVLRVGGVFDGFRLRAIGQASAQFTNVQTGERLELRVPRSRR